MRWQLLASGRALGGDSGRREGRPGSRGRGFGRGGPAEEGHPAGGGLFILDYAQGAEGVRSEAGMAYTIKRQLSDDEKERVLKQHGRHCFATGHYIPEGEEIQFDHIRAFALNGPSEVDNIAPMCATHNREKGTLPLFDFRVKLRLGEFFSTADKLTLKHLLEYLRSKGEISDFARPVALHEDSGQVVIESPSRKYVHSLYTCPTTGWKYFYSTLDVDVIDSDDDQDHAIGLQPRYLIPDKVFELFRHFQAHPVLQPSIGRVVNNRVRLFDGQHKVAALLWNGHRKFECKVYIATDIRLLNQTNIAAHDKFAQTRFFASIMVMKLGKQFGADFDAYKNLEDGRPKSEAGFVDYLAQKEGGVVTRGELNTRFRSYLYNAVLQDEQNRMSRLVSAGNRRTDEKPLTMDMLSKSLFAGFLYREPTTDNMATEAHKRDAEVRNMVFLMNTLNEFALRDWNTKADVQNENQRRLNRVFGSKSMMAWSELLLDAVCAKLDVHDSDEKARIFYRDFSEQQLARIRDVVARLASWKRWVAPANDEIDKILSDNKSRVKAWLKEHGLTTGYLLGAPE